MKSRSAISDNLYEDVIPCLEWLRGQGVQVGVMTNGNADLTDTILHQYLTLSVTAGQAGSIISIHIYR